jgi:hypothetical protein
MRLSELNLFETPLMHISVHDEMKMRYTDDGDDVGEGSFSKADRALIDKYIKNDTYKEKLKKLPFNLYVYLVDNVAIKKFGEEYPEGEVKASHIKANKYWRTATKKLNLAHFKLSLAAIEANKQKDPAGVHFIMGDNFSDDDTQIAPTPWIITHRFIHCIANETAPRAFKRLTRIVDIVRENPNLRYLKDTHEELYKLLNSRAQGQVSFCQMRL